MLFQRIRVKTKYLQFLNVHESLEHSKGSDA
jgi:hypothetical protein